jgi:hypothetical protein
MAVYPLDMERTVQDGSCVWRHAPSFTRWQRITLPDDGMSSDYCAFPSLRTPACVPVLRHHHRSAILQACFTGVNVLPQT